MSSLYWMSSPNSCVEACNIIGTSNDIEKIVHMENKNMVFHSRDAYDYIIGLHSSSSLPLCIGEDQDLQLCSTMDIPALDNYSQDCLTSLSTSLVHDNELADVFDCINHANLFENAIDSSAQCSSTNLTPSTSRSEDGKDTSSQDLTSSTAGYDHEQSVISNVFKSASASVRSFLGSCNLLEDMLSESFATSATSTHGARHGIDDGGFILGNSHEIGEALKIAGSEGHSPSNMVNYEIFSGQSPSAGSECQSYEGHANNLGVQDANNAGSSTTTGYTINNGAASSVVLNPDEHLMILSRSCGHDTCTNSESYQLLQIKGVDQCSAGPTYNSGSCVRELDCFDDHRMCRRLSACSTMADGERASCMQDQSGRFEYNHCASGGADERCSSLLGAGAAGGGNENNEISSRRTSAAGDDTKQDIEGNIEWGAKEQLSPAKEMLYRATALSWREDDGEEEAAIMRAWRRRRRRRNVKVSKDPQSVAARLRRERISQKIRILQGLVPGGTKMDTASMLDEAVLYLKFLKAEIHQLSLLPPPPPPPPSVPGPGTTSPPVPYTCWLPRH